MSGYIKLWRGSRDTDGIAASTVYSEWEAWTWLLENAAWKELSRWNAKGEEITLSPGQIHVSLRSLSKAWGWKKDRVKRFLARLERVGKATQLPRQSGTVLTIEKWAKYQGDATADETASQTVTRQPRDTQEEGKEGKEEKNTHYAFFGRTIKLNDNDYRRWKDRYHAIPDFDATLGALDDWINDEPESQRKKWFQIISGALNKKHVAALDSHNPEKLEYGPC